MPKKAELKERAAEIDRMANDGGPHAVGFGQALAELEAEGSIVIGDFLTEAGQTLFRRGRADMGLVEINFLGTLADWKDQIKAIEEQAYLSGRSDEHDDT